MLIGKAMLRTELLMTFLEIENECVNIAEVL